MSILNNHFDNCHIEQSGTHKPLIKYKLKYTLSRFKVMNHSTVRIPQMEDNKWKESYAHKLTNWL